MQRHQRVVHLRVVHLHLRVVQRIPVYRDLTYSTLAEPCHGFGPWAEWQTDTRGLNVRHKPQLQRDKVIFSPHLQERFDMGNAVTFHTFTTPVSVPIRPEITP